MKKCWRCNVEKDLSLFKCKGYKICIQCLDNLHYDERYCTRCFKIKQISNFMNAKGKYINQCCLCAQEVKILNFNRRNKHKQLKSDTEQYCMSCDKLLELNNFNKNKDEDYEVVCKTCKLKVNNRLNSRREKNKSVKLKYIKFCKGCKQFKFKIDFSKKWKEKRKKTCTQCLKDLEKSRNKSGNYCHAQRIFDNTAQMNEVLNEEKLNIDIITKFCFGCNQIFTSNEASKWSDNDLKLSCIKCLTKSRKYQNNKLTQPIY